MFVIKHPVLRKVLRVLLPFFVIPLVVFVAAVALREKAYLFISFFVAILSLLLFFCGFEKKKIGTRRLVLVSVMTALSVFGRFLPFFKPITAFSIITGLYIGPEAGFLVGSLSAVISNFYFGQGPWTPFQMLAWGLIGFFAGVLSKFLTKNKGLLYGYGIVSAVLFSLVMDIYSVLWVGGEFLPSLYLAKILTALPHTALYAVSNLIFLALFAKPFGEKLARVKIKYGI